MNQLARGESAALPLRYLVHRVAARYGQSPAAVRDWPADDFMDAVGMLPATDPRAVIRG